jgi:hypothetical protein
MELPNRILEMKSVPSETWGLFSELYEETGRELRP